MIAATHRDLGDLVQAHLSIVKNGLGSESAILARDEDGLALEPPILDPGASEVQAFFRKIARALDTVDEILIVGPSATNLGQRLEQSTG